MLPLVRAQSVTSAGTPADAKCSGRDKHAIAHDQFNLPRGLRHGPDGLLLPLVPSARQRRPKRRGLEKPVRRVPKKQERADDRTRIPRGRFHEIAKEIGIENLIVIHHQHVVGFFGQCRPDSDIRPFGKKKGPVPLYHADVRKGSRDRLPSAVGRSVVYYERTDLDPIAIYARKAFQTLQTNSTPVVNRRDDSYSNVSRTHLPLVWNICIAVPPQSSFKRAVFDASFMPFPNGTYLICF